MFGKGPLNTVEGTPEGLGAFLANKYSTARSDNAQEYT